MHPFNATQTQKTALLAYLKEHAEIELTAEEEDIPIRGNAIASGDDKQDREIEDRIIEDLESGNEWAWCCAKVTASFAGYEGTDYLGGCSYKNADDFKAPGGYFESMKEQAIENLATAVLKDAEHIQELSAIFNNESRS